MAPRTSSHNASLLGDSHAGRARAVVTLNSKDLIVVGTKVEADVLPGLEMSTGIDGSAGTLVASDRPVLLKGLVTVNGGGVDTGADVDIVDRSVNIDLTLLLATGRGVVSAEVLNDVVLNERVAGPTVNGEVAVAVGVVRTRVLDGAAHEVSMRLREAAQGELTEKYQASNPFHRRGCRCRSTAC